MIYEYTCKDCDLVFTEMRKMAERTDPIDCPACSGEGKFKFSTPRFRTSGGGHSTNEWNGLGKLK
jgi:putative FmdB family regulatory protein